MDAINETHHSRLLAKKRISYYTNKKAIRLFMVILKQPYLQVDLDGTKEYHPVRWAKIAITENIHVFPNPIVPGRASFTVEMERSGFQKMAYRLLNSNGLQVQTGYITQPVQQLFTSGLSEGFYLLCIGNRKPVKLEVRSRF